MDVKDLAVNVAQSALDSVKTGSNIGEIAEHAAEAAIQTVTQNDPRTGSLVGAIFGFLISLFKRK